MAQTTNFFENADQMAIPNRTVLQLATEGITMVEDLSEFDPEDFAQIADNLRKPPSIPDIANPGQLVRQEPFVLGAKSLKRLKVAAKAVRYYEMIGRVLTSNMMHYGNTLVNFEQQWKSLEERKKEDVPDVPRITRNLKVTKWSESFNDFLSKVIGKRYAPLSYVIRENEAVPAVAPPLMTNQPHSQEHGSVEGELIARLSHTSPIFRDDNKQVYLFLEEATRSTIYGASIKPFTRSKNGRGAYLALINQHAGVDKWEKELKDQEQFLLSRKWKGNSNQSLDKFVEQHRAAFILMTQCSEHVNHQLPNEHSRVRYLLDAIECSDPALHARKAQIETDTGPNGMRSNFEAAAAFLLPADPVAKKRKTNNHGGGSYVSNVSSAVVAAADGTLKPRAGKTGVELRYYKQSEYRKLSDEQKRELKVWRQSKSEKDDGKSHARDDDDKSGTKPSKKFKREIKAVLGDLMKDIESKKQKEASEISQISAVLSSLQSAPTKAPAPAPTPDPISSAARNLQSILKRSSKPN